MQLACSLSELALLRSYANPLSPRGRGKVACSFPTLVITSNRRLRSNLINIQRLCDCDVLTPFVLAMT